LPHLLNPFLLNKTIKHYTGMSYLDQASFYAKMDAVENTHMAARWFHRQMGTTVGREVFFHHASRIPFVRNYITEPHVVLEDIDLGRLYYYNWR